MINSSLVKKNKLNCLFVAIAFKFVKEMSSGFFFAQRHCQHHNPKSCMLSISINFHCSIIIYKYLRERQKEDEEDRNSKLRLIASFTRMPCTEVERIVI